MDTSTEINIPIRIECFPNSNSGWDIVDTIDERDGSFLGCIGVYEFDGSSSAFPDQLMTAVIKQLDEEADAFNDPQAIYNVNLAICDGGQEIGNAFRTFRKP